MNVLRWLMTLSSGGASEQIGTRVKSLLDTKPLAKLIRDLMQPYRIQEHLDKGLLEGIAVSATCYDSGDLTVFIQTGLNQTVWRRFSRLAKRSFITPEHILASCALPILFPAVKIQERFYGDGSIRNMAPLSPAIHLGAERILAIGVREQLGESESPPPPAANPDSRYPSLAGISGLLLDSIFLDALESDRENMERINRLSGLLPRQLKPGRKEWFRQIKFLYIGPSKRLSLIAQKHQQALPRTLKYMLRGLGLKADSGGELLSYLLFESAYCQELLALGYEVARSRSDEIKSFLWEDG
jgi:NTE family protein